MKFSLAILFVALLAVAAMAENHEETNFDGILTDSEVSSGVE